MQFSQSLDAVKPSATLALNAAALKIGATSLAVGELKGIPTPPHILAPMVKSITDGALNSYGQAKYDTAVREAFCTLYNSLGYDWQPDDCAPCAGGKEGLGRVLRAILNPGDEVIFPAPYWVSNRDITLINYGVPKPVFCSAAQGYLMNDAQLEAAITPRTRAIILNSPSNPTGRIYSEAQLRAIGEVLLKHPNIWILLDDIYQHLVFDGVFVSLLKLFPELADRIVVFDSASKTYLLPGARIGMMASKNKEMVKVLKKLGSNTITQVPADHLAGLAAAYTGPQDFLIGVNADLKAKRDAALPVLLGIKGVQCPVPQGAFYLFPDLSPYIGATYKGVVIADDGVLCQLLIEHKKLALVPGSEFGYPGAVRFSTAVTMETLMKAVHDLADFCAECEGVKLPA